MLGYDCKWIFLKITEQLAKRLKVSLFMARLGKKKEKHLL
jgi:hypothetical protein